jgi:hypothetical protein
MINQQPVTSKNTQGQTAEVKGHSNLLIKKNQDPNAKKKVGVAPAVSRSKGMILSTAGSGSEYSKEKTASRGVPTKSEESAKWEIKKVDSSFDNHSIPQTLKASRNDTDPSKIATSEKNG